MSDDDKQLTIRKGFSLDTALDKSHEHGEIREDISKTRKRLGEFTLREMSMGLMGEEFTNALFGDDGGDVSVSDIELHTSKDADGKFRLSPNRDNIRKILSEAFPNKSENEIEALLAAPDESVKARLITSANEELERSEAAAADSYTDMVRKSNFGSSLKK